MNTPMTGQTIPERGSDWLHGSLWVARSPAADLMGVCSWRYIKCEWLSFATMPAGFPKKFKEREATPTIDATANRRFA
jgi:hypothetical protein